MEKEKKITMKIYYFSLFLIQLVIITTVAHHTYLDCDSQVFTV